ncbi:histidine kinase [Paenibacillus sambharensis]|uniref:Circadian input-output histidine kinase CikA n=1 Tax=Paenibacillus sambharensis TaxID=1803190 RepID=A0A2W1LYV7_9BACL|nr:ATP-binding protein [Paenibacillus sambharensis]PZD96687.1 histidine kinase [Paenibacillus sambharensis]
MKTDYIDDLLTIVSRNIYDTAAQVMSTASSMIPANTFCIAINDRLTTTVLKAYNREELLLAEGLIVDNEDSYCHLVIEKSAGPLVVPDNFTHPLTKDMDATRFVGGCSFMGVKIIKRGGEVYGSLCAFDHNYYAYTDKDVALMESLAAFFANVLELEDTVHMVKKAERAVVGMRENKNNLVAMLSHEIRTPMNAVMGLTELLQSTELNREQRGFVDMIRSSGDSLLKLLGSVLDYSKYEAETIVLKNRPFDLAGCISQVQDLFVAETRGKGLQLKTEIDAEVPGILIGDEVKIRQVLVNLVSNAIKFTERGQVTVGIKLQRLDRAAEVASLLFTVRDTGVGVPAEQADDLFRPFIQLHDPAQTGYQEGSGLGLSICKQLVEGMDGSIWLMETGEKGSCFAFEIMLPYRSMTSLAEIEGF